MMDNNNNNSAGLPSEETPATPEPSFAVDGDLLNKSGVLTDDGPESIDFSLDDSHDTILFTARTEPKSRSRVRKPAILHAAAQINAPTATSRIINAFETAGISVRARECTVAVRRDGNIYNYSPTIHHVSFTVSKRVELMLKAWCKRQTRGADLDVPLEYEYWTVTLDGLIVFNMSLRLFAQRLGKGLRDKFGDRSLTAKGVVMLTILNGDSLTVQQPTKKRIFIDLVSSEDGCDVDDKEEEPAQKKPRLSV
jgi:hypothetical protein